MNVLPNRIQLLALASLLLLLTVAHSPLGFAEQSRSSELPYPAWELLEVTGIPSGGHGQSVAAVSDGFFILRQYSTSREPSILHLHVDDDATLWLTPIDFDDQTSESVLARLETGTATAWDGERFVYVLAGSAYARDRYDVLRFDTLTGSWEDFAPTSVTLDDGVTIAGAQGAGAAIAYAELDEGPYLYAVLGRARVQVSPRARWQPTVMIRYQLEGITNSWEIVSVFNEPMWPTDSMGRFCTDDGASLVVVGDHLYLLSGSNCDDLPTSTFARFELPLGPWEPLEPMLASVGANDGASLAWDGAGYIYAIAGGHCEFGPGKGATGVEFARFDLDTWRWSSLNPLPVPVGDHPGNRLVVHGEHLYLWQGTNRSCNGTPVDGGGNALYRILLSEIAELLSRP